MGAGACRRCLSIVPLILAAWTGVCGASQAASDEPLRVFHSDDPAVATAALPQDVVRGLGVDVRMVECFLDESTGWIGFDREWFVAYRFDLDADGRRDWIVRGEHDCLRDDAAALWWLYRDTREGRQDVLRVTAESLAVLASRHNGFHDLRRQRTTANGRVGTLGFRFLGGEYRPWRGGKRPNPEE